MIFNGSLPQHFQFKHWFKFKHFLFIGIYKKGDAQYPREVKYSDSTYGPHAL